MRIAKKGEQVRLIGNGTLDAPLKVAFRSATGSAVRKVVSAGGSYIPQPVYKNKQKLDSGQKHLFTYKGMQFSSFVTFIDSGPSFHVRTEFFLDDEANSVKLSKFKLIMVAIGAHFGTNSDKEEKLSISYNLDDIFSRNSDCTANAVIEFNGVSFGTDSHITLVLLCDGYPIHESRISVACDVIERHRAKDLKYDIT